MNVAIIGLGRMGRRHLEAVNRNPDCKLIGVFDTQPHDQTPLTLPQIQKYADAVIIASSTPTHASYSMLFECPVLVEKPIALTEESANTLAKRPHLFVGMCERYNYARIPKKSRVQFVRYGREPENAAQYGGQLKDLLVHDLDLLLYSGIPLAPPTFFDLGLEYQLEIGKITMFGGYQEPVQRSIYVDGEEWPRNPEDKKALDRQLADFVSYWYYNRAPERLCTAKQGAEVVKYACSLERRLSLLEK